ncbi:unnamed protein product, partial [Rotaria magnacalcarata]
RQLRTTTQNFNSSSESEDTRESESSFVQVPDEVEDEAYSNNDDSTDCDEKSNDNFSESESESNNENDENSYDEDDENSKYADKEADENENIHCLVSTLVKRIRACVGNIRSTRASVEYTKKKAKSMDPPVKYTLITDIEIRWNTTFIMINRFTDYRSIIDDINSRPHQIPYLNPSQGLKFGSKNFEFTNDNWCQIHDLKNVLEPFMVSTNVVSAKNYPTLATSYSDLYIYFSVRSNIVVQYALRLFVNSTSGTDSAWFKSLKACLRTKFHLYFDEKISEYQKNTSLVAAFLDPNEYRRLRKRPSELESAINLLKIEMGKDTQRISERLAASHSDNETVRTSEPPNVSSTNTNLNNLDTLFSLCGCSDESTIASAQSQEKALSIDEEIGLYISSINSYQNIKFSNFWSIHEKQLSVMSCVVRRISIIPASPVPCESTFSVAGYIRRKERYSLSSQAMRYSIVLKDRHKLSLFDN